MTNSIKIKRSISSKEVSIEKRFNQSKKQFTYKQLTQKTIQFQLASSKGKAIFRKYDSNSRA